LISSPLVTGVDLPQSRLRGFVAYCDSQQKEDVMWDGYTPMHWTFFGPFMMVLFAAAFAAALFFVYCQRMRHRPVATGWGMQCCGSGRLEADDRVKYDAPSASHSAFDEYREATLQRLEHEQRDFQDFVGRLRAAKDKAEFDQFMADRQKQSAAG
jgi:hypothetical protein